jgi:hypothetical protein
MSENSKPLRSYLISKHDSTLEIGINIKVECASSEMCGHHTQVVWHDSTQLGAWDAPKIFFFLVNSARNWIIWRYKRRSKFIGGSLEFITSTNCLQYDTIYTLSILLDLISCTAKEIACTSVCKGEEAWKYTTLYEISCSLCFNIAAAPPCPPLVSVKEPSTKQQ